MSTTVRIALAQTCPVSAPEGPPKLEKPHSSSPFPTLETNLVDAAHRVARAIELGADVVVFPEYFLQGIANESRQYLAFPSRHLLSFLQALAKKHSIAIVGTIVHGSLPSSGSGEPFPTVSPFEHLLAPVDHAAVCKITENQLVWAKYLQRNPQTAEDNAAPVLHNTAFFIDDSGAVVGEYIKQNLWHPERDYLTAGVEKHQVFNTKWGKAGLLICWDVSHPAAAQALADLGADIIFAPTYWLGTDSEPMIHRHAHDPNYETSMLSALSFARSFETETVWVMGNAGGDVAEGFMGGSAVWAPLRGRVGGWDGPEVGVKVVEVDVAVLKDGREMYKIREDWFRKQA